ncbi:hypothetical protein IAU60_003193 [Kwoniella sp. DSM 27419]
MLPSEPPKPSGRDFDPATMSVDDDAETRSEDGSAGLEMSSVEINILVYLYLLESNFTHTAFTLLSESNLPQTSLFQHFNPSYPTPGSSSKARATPNGLTPGLAQAQAAGQGSKSSPVQPNFGRVDGRIERGALVKKLWKAVRWEEVERHVSPSGEPLKPACPNPFHLLIPHVCPSSFPSSSQNPPLPLPSALRSSPPPAKRPEAFPPPELVAGPSKNAGAAESNGTRGKRKARQMSNDSPDASRQSSPSRRSDSPAKAKTPVPEAKRDRRGQSGKRQARAASEEDAERMDVDQPEKKEVKIASPKKAASKVPSSAVRVPSPDGRKSPAGKRQQVAPTQGIETWTEHRDAVSCVTWNPMNRDVLATASADGTARLWEFGQPDSNEITLSKKPTVIAHKSIESSKKTVTAVCWHPDGTILATGSYDGVGRLFTPSGQLQAIMSYGRGAINALKFNPSGTIILTAKDDFTVCKWAHGQGYTMEMKMCFDAHTKEVNDVDWLDDDVFASGGNDHTIFVHRATERRPRFTFKGHLDDVTRVKWSPAEAGKPVTSRLLASVSDDGNCMIWKLPNYPEPVMPSTSTGSRSMSPVKGRDGSGEDDYFTNGTPVPGADHCLHRLNVVSNSDNKRMNTLEWSPACAEGRMLLAAGGQDSTVKVFDALSGECLHVLKGLETGTGSLAFSPLGFGGKLGALAAGGWNGHLIVFDLDTGKPLLQHDVDEDQSKQNTREKPMMGLTRE